jgi:RimJ/RimL family protein N-acetyltransferase
MVPAMTGYPKEYEKTLTLKDGTTVHFRPELHTDTEMLWQMFSTLSQESLRNLVNPFPRERIKQWTSNINYDKTLPIVAVVQESRKPRIVATASLEFRSAPGEKHKADFGITVHDAYQNQGIGTALTKHIVSIARKKGLCKINLRVTAPNKRAINVYEKCGFKTEARLRKENFINGKYIDDLVMSIFL